MFIPNNINLLYIEDDEENANLILSFLKLSEYTKFNTTHKSTLEQGLDYITDNCISTCNNTCKTQNIENCGTDVILLDLVLQNSRGVDTYKSVLEKCPCIPIVIISGYEQMAYECVKLGAQDYLVKPHINPGLIIRSLVYAIERNNLENSKIQAEKKFREVIYATPIGFHNYELKEEDLIFIGYNPAADRILKIDHKQLLGKTIDQAFPSLTKMKIPEKYKIVAKTGKPWESQILEYEDHNIKKAYFKIHAFRTYPGSITSSFEDITEQIIATEKLEYSEKRFRNLVEITGAGIYEIDLTNGKFTYVNHVMCKQTGYTKEELFEIGPSGLLTQKSYLDWVDRWERFTDPEYINGGAYDGPFQYEAIAKDGSHLWSLVIAEFVMDKNKNITKANVVAIDITKQKLIESQLKKKEDIIFNQLEDKIHQWRDEITERSSVEFQKLKDMDNKIISISNQIVE